MIIIFDVVGLITLGVVVSDLILNIVKSIQTQKIAKKRLDLDENKYETGKKTEEEKIQLAKAKAEMDKLQGLFETFNKVKEIPLFKPYIEALENPEQLPEKLTELKNLTKQISDITKEFQEDHENEDIYK